VVSGPTGAEYRTGAPGVVLIHGGYHGAWCWERLLEVLNCRGIAVDLPGRGRHPAVPDDVTVESSALSVVDDIDRAGFDRVVLVGHSLGGVTVPVVARLLGHRAVHLVFVSCLVAPDGESVMSMRSEEERRAAEESLRTGPGERTELTRERHAALLCNDLDSAQQEYVLGRVGPDSMRFFTDRVRWGELVGSMPKTYVKLLQDRAVSASDQDEMIRRLGCHTTIKCIDAGHEVMISQPASLGRILDEIVADAAV
jgi:pimeloyl-ACP methyl ester carboxylesterase